MAASWLRPLNVSQGKAAAQTIIDCLDYAMNPEKTDNGRLVTGYQCDPHTAAAEFILSKQRYKYITGREQESRDILLYRIRQSFKPGEITPEEANRIGYELALRFTKGKHAFTVSTHIDKAHIHNHVIFNSTALDCTRKFINFKGSSWVVRRLSDQICLEHGLSVIENPKPSRGNYGQWLKSHGEKKKPSFQQIIRQAIDSALEQKPADFDSFLRLMEEAGIGVIRQGKHLKFKALGQKQVTRCNTLKGDYTEEAIRERIAGKRKPQRTSAHAFSSAGRSSPNLLIDIQARMQAGKGAGYERWAKVFNLKEMAKTLIYLEEHGLTEYAMLQQETAAATHSFHTLSDEIKAIESRMSEINDLQKHIGDYNRTRDVYRQYKASRFSKSFRAEHEGAILLHQAAKKAFDALGVEKLPTIKALQTEYAKLLTEKKGLYKDYRQARDRMRSLQTAKANTDTLMRAVPSQEQDRQR